MRATPRIPPLVLDCDVEAPDAHLFLHPEMDSSREVTLLIPVVARDRCTLGGECVAVRELGIPMGVVINRDGIGNRAVDEFCAAEGVPILLRVPFHREIAEEIARGGTLLAIRPEYRVLLREMIGQITATALQKDGGKPGGVGDAQPGKRGV